jgi:D-3-phosphoglycerate dehydrogenase / 2-oxoglutarate reductase
MPTALRRPVVVAAAKGMISPELKNLLSDRAELVLDPRLPAGLGEADAFLASAHLPLSASHLKCAPRLGVVTQVGTAVHVDVAAATRLGIPVLHNRGRNADSVAEHTIALLLTLAKNIVRSDAEVHSRVRWDVAASHLINHELRGKTLGIVGFGAIGQRVADIASLGLGMRVLGCDAVPGVVAARGYEEVALDDLLPRVDVLSLHLAANPETAGLISGVRLRHLRRHAWLINTARADVLDYEALIEALRDGHIAAAGIDTWPGHRADPQSPLIDLPNVVLTQHNAGFTHEAISRMVQATVAGIWEVLAGEAPTSSTLVNSEVWERRRPPSADLQITSTRTPAARSAQPG